MPEPDGTLGLHPSQKTSTQAIAAARWMHTQCRWNWHHGSMKYETSMSCPQIARHTTADLHNPWNCSRMNMSSKFCQMTTTTTFCFCQPYCLLASAGATWEGGKISGRKTKQPIPHSLPPQKLTQQFTQQWTTHTTMNNSHNNSHNNLHVFHLTNGAGLYVYALDVSSSDCATFLLRLHETCFQIKYHGNYIAEWHSRHDQNIWREHVCNLEHKYNSILFFFHFSMLTVYGHYWPTSQGSAIHRGPITAFAWALISFSCSFS